MHTSNTALIEALWSRTDILKSGVTQKEVENLTLGILETVARLGFTMLKSEDLWDFDESLNRWFNENEKRLLSFDPLSEWQVVLRQLPRRQKTVA